MHYLEFLRGVHDQLQPETYLEVGLRNGDSLALARCRSVGVDPAYNLTAELDGDFTILRTTSDDFFAQDDPRRVTRGRAFDLTFIDGLHLFEYSLRDFIHTERHSGRGSVIVFDDVLPRSSDEAARERHTSFWTGDVYKIAAVLAHYRPELTALIVDTEPTGLLLVMGLDPDNTTLTENYDQILAEFRTPDPQVVPDEVLRRQHALSPRRVLAGQMWSLLRDARSGPVKVELGGLLRAAAAETSRETHDDDAGPDSAPALEVAEALASCDFRSDEASIVESVEGALLRLPLRGVRLQPERVVPGELQLGSLVVPARLRAAGPDAVVQAWVSALPGEYPLAIRFGDIGRDCGIHLLVGPAGEFDLIPAPAPEPIPEPIPEPDHNAAGLVTAPPGGHSLRAVARRVPVFRALVQAARRARG
jgi:hypothetical protein